MAPTFPKTDGDVLYADDINSMPPIGSIMAWHKSFTNTPTLPENWVECNGQVLSDAESVYNGQTIPDLNGSSGTERFLRGQTTSGGTGGSETHSHDSASAHGGNSNSTWETQNNDWKTSTVSTLPSYFEVVWIMKIK